MGVVSTIMRRREHRVVEGAAVLTAIQAMGLRACDLIDLNVSVQVVCTTCGHRWEKGTTPFRCPKYKGILHG